MLNKVRNYKIIKYFNFNKENIVYITILVLALILFLIIKNSPFNSDDWFLLFSAKNNHFPFKGDWINGSDLYYRPVVMLSFYLNFLITGIIPLSYYVINILIHVVNTFLIILLFKKIDRLYENNFDISNINFLGIIFFILPQNIYNVFWISGRTDLLCFLFLIISFNSSFNILSHEKIRIKHFVTFIVFLLLAFMSKETAVVIIFYLSVLFLLLDLKNRNILNKLVLLFLTAIFIISLFIILRILLWGTLTSSEISLKPLSYYTYMCIYGLASFLMPFDIVEYYSSYFNSIYLFSFISVLLCIVFVIIIILISRFNKKTFLRFLTVFIISSLSMLIYFLKYPVSRLAYSHILLYFIPFILIINFKFNLNKNLIKIIKIAILTLTITGDIILFNQKSIIDDYNNNVISIFKNNNSNDKNVVSLASIMRIGQNWCLPPFNEIKNINRNIEFNSYTVSAFGILMSFKDNYFNSIEYFRYGDTSIIVNSLSNTLLLSLVKEPFYLLNKESVKITDEIEMQINKMSDSRPKYATSIIISFSPKIIEQNDVIYFSDEKLYKEPFNLFINKLKYYDEHNN